MYQMIRCNSFCFQTHLVKALVVPLVSCLAGTSPGIWTGFRIGSASVPSGGSKRVTEANNDNIIYTTSFLLLVVRHLLLLAWHLLLLYIQIYHIYIYRCIASSNRCLTSSNKKLLGTINIYYNLGYILYNTIHIYLYCLSIPTLFTICCIIR